MPAARSPASMEGGTVGSAVVGPVDRRPGFRFESLPSEVFVKISACLLGDELIQLSHVNRRLFFELLADPTVWTTRMQLSEDDAGRGKPATGHDAKYKYAHETSLLFHGTATQGVDQNARGACVPVPTFFRREDRFRRSPRQSAQLLNHPFTMDIWFSVLPSDRTKYDGGVIVGSQSIPSTATDRWADNPQQFVYLDTKRSLYCSVLGRDEVIAEKLQVGSWYHLALTFDGGEQAVFLNGSLSLTQGSVHHEWRFLHYTQLGTASLTGASAAKPSPDFTGWYAFRGIIDEFRLWKRALELQEVELLAKGVTLSLRPVYSMRNDRSLELHGAVERVHCSRPMEKLCVLRTLIFN